MEQPRPDDRADHNEIKLQGWHKPEVRRLLVSLDTSIAKPGSAADGDSFDRVAGIQPD